ncbi:hypothetical protein MTR67_001151 [Solanum verrucosum]|uniref:Fatty acid hydroxylase domain-containing protein n=1 Tax=Solanum verrucosum TaxID=315347 RepID=A0AAF0PS77_SOLVR|nr:hypothetical protein MTR67_001151 [Solanum verrucosum]
MSIDNDVLRGGLHVSDELLGTILPIVVYWVYSGLYCLLGGMENYRLHTKKDEDEKNLVTKKEVVKGVLLQQVVQSIVATVLFAILADTGTDISLVYVAAGHQKVLFSTYPGFETRGSLCFLIHLGSGPNSLEASHILYANDRLILCRAEETEEFRTTYLGMPSGAKYKAKQVWHRIVDRFEKKLATWKRQYLSLGGRVALINNMLASLSTYRMSLFPMSINVTGNDGDSEGNQHGFLVLVRQLFVAMVILDTWQYFMHRYMHQNKFLYKHIHSQHHRLVVPYAFGALYNHPLEGLLLDTIGGALAFLFSGMSPRASIFFFSFATIKTVDDHCGLWLPGNLFHIVFKNNSAYHDIHHQLYGSKYNFSQPFFVTWDRILGTYMPYALVEKPEGGYEARPDKDCKDD